MGAEGAEPTAAAQRRAVCSGSARSQAARPRPRCAGSTKACERCTTSGPGRGRPLGSSRIDGRVVAQRRDLPAASQHQQLVGERGPPDRPRRIPGQPLADHRACLHLAARAELGEEPVVGHRKVGIGHLADAPHPELRRVARSRCAVARGEVVGDEAGSSTRACYRRVRRRASPVWRRAGGRA